MTTEKSMRMGHLIARNVFQAYGMAWRMLGGPVREAIVDAAVFRQLQQQDNGITDAISGTALMDRANEWRTATYACLASFEMNI